MDSPSDARWQAAAEQLLRDGFAVVPNFCSAARLNAMRDRAAQIVDEFDEQTHLSVFVTGDGQEKTTDDYFLTSGDKIRCFVEASAVSNGRLTTTKALSVNKIGHALHEKDELFHSMVTDSDVRALARVCGTALGYRGDPTVVQSMFIFKHSRIGGRVAPHQDSTFLYTTPLSTFGFWLALEDVTIDNGALWAIPGSHLEWPINRRFVRASQGGVKFDGSDNYPEESDPRWKPLECAAGTLILIHGSVLHYSKPNNSGVSRNAWTFHIIDSAAAYSELNWLNPPALVPL